MLQGFSALQDKLSRARGGLQIFRIGFISRIFGQTIGCFHIELACALQAFDQRRIKDFSNQGCFARPAHTGHAYEPPQGDAHREVF
ncbi:hypothetical protein SDC9_180007 [bioreactor metagenome]|uniref:Uncharacterized protein n=1 Tax=bioreactor metagenome TaxID=1076179 RepID=A0A645H0L9_9ZZZZ